MSRIGRLFGRFRTTARSDSTERKESSTIGWIVAGLGNPGKDYAGSPHNSGFLVLDRLAAARRAEFSKRRFGGVTLETELAGERAILIKPQTYYNKSGECLAGLLGYFKVPPSRLIVVHDEMDLERGRIRIKSGGADAGNRGVRSVVEALATADFIRVRIGIGHPGGSDESRDYLLRSMHPDEARDFSATLDRAAEAVEAIASEGLERAMGRFNQRK